jgi:hypothetical protein
LREPLREYGENKELATARLFLPINKSFLRMVIRFSGQRRSLPFKSVLLNAVSSGYTASKAASRMIFTPNRRPKIILPATFSLSNPGDPVFNNTL